MSTRAVRTEIALQGLDPRLPHSKVDKKGRLVPHGAGPGAAPAEVIEVPVVVVEEPKVKNALVQLESEPEETKTEVVEESKQDAPETEEVPKKKLGKKEKKVVSTDP